MLADKGHTLKIDPSNYGQTAVQEPKKKKNECPNGVFLSFYGDVAREPCPLSSLPGSEMEGAGCGQSVMSKKTLEEQRGTGTPPGLNGTELID